jgi:hypothetical protein
MAIYINSYVGRVRTYYSKDNKVVGIESIIKPDIRNEAPIAKMTAVDNYASKVGIIFDCDKCKNTVVITSECNGLKVTYASYET